MLEAICIPLQCNVTDGIDRNRVLSTLCCLAESPGARQVMIGMQAVQTLAGLIDQVLHALASDVCSLVPTEAERTLELIGHLLWQLSTDDPPAFVSDFAGYGGFVLLDRLLLADRSALTCLALKVRGCAAGRAGRCISWTIWKKPCCQRRLDGLTGLCVSVKMLNLLVSTPHEANQDARLSVPRLVEIARAGTADLQEESINIIRKLAKDEESCSEIVASDAVPVLADILRSAQDVPILKACIKAIRTIGGWQVCDLPHPLCVEG